MKDNNTILNGIVYNASMIMLNKKKYNQLIIEQLEDKEGSRDTVQLLSDMNKRIDSAVDLMHENAGCWL